MLENIVSYRNVTKSYVSSHANILALDDIVLDVRKNEFLVLIGRSGSGKSTLLKITAGLIDASSGSVVVNGKDPIQARRDIGIVFQKPVLLRWLSIKDNVLIPVDILHLDREKYTQRALELLNLVGLSGFEEHYPFELSGGMQQRVALCRALIHDPEILLMDEPFGALDALTRDEMNQELLKLWQGNKTVIFVTHSIPEAVYLADRVAVLTARPGRVSEIVEVNIDRPRNPEVRYSRAFAEYSEKLLKLISAN